METILIRTAQLILSLSILVIVHECGHFFMAKLFKVRVEKFYLFFNPWFTLFKFKPKGSDTEYGIGWLPLGGYVKISGMIDESMDREAMAQPPQPWEFRTKPAWQRLLVMIGGVLMNFILAFFIYAMIVLTWGEKIIPTSSTKLGFSYNEAVQRFGFQNGDLPVSIDGKPVGNVNVSSIPFELLTAKEVTVRRNNSEVSINLPDNFKNILADPDSKEPSVLFRYPFVVKQVMNGDAAKKAGLETGDSIVGIDGQTNMDAVEIMNALGEYKDKEIALSFYRNGHLMETQITPNSSGKIGVGVASPFDVYETIDKRYNFFGAFPAGVRIGWETMSNYVKSLSLIFTKDGAKSLGGFGAIASIFPEKWNWGDFWNMTAFLSIILGVMNLLPIPALDGGHVLFLLYEVVSGRKPNEKFMEYAQVAGMFFLIALLLYANGNDVFRTFFK